MLEKILRFSIFHPVAVILLTLAAAAYGVYAFTKLPIDAVPDITTNQVQINTTLPGFAPAEIEKQVTYVVETALSGIPGLEQTRSLSRNGFSQVTAVFDDNVNVYFARQQINEKLGEIKANLPEGAEIEMGPLSTGLGEVYMWTVDFAHPDGVGATIKPGKPGWQSNGAYLTPEGHLLKTELEKAAYLRTVQDWVISPQLKGVPGLAEIDSMGGYVRQYHIEPNMEKLSALGLQLSDIVNVLHRNNNSIGPGFFEKGGEAFLVQSDERIERISDIETVVVTIRNGLPIRIRDIATVGIGKEIRTGSATKNGREVVVGTALMLIGANSRTVAQAVDDRLRTINATLPNDIIAETAINRTTLVNATIHTVTKNLGEGALLVIAVLFAFLGYFRAALIAALVIPLSMLMTAIGMVQTHISGNLMSLGAIDFGLIVDGAVIITENCLRRLANRQHELGRVPTHTERLDEIMLASQEMIKPSVFGQAIILIVYVPILVLSGVEGKMFHPMAMTVLFALIAAFVLSLTLVPALIALLVKGPFQETENAIVKGAKTVYRPVLDFALHYPYVIISSASALVIGAFFLFNHLGEEFVPTLDEQDIAMHAIRIPSISLDQSTKMQREVERTLLQFPEVAYAYSKTGTAEAATDPMPPNVSDTFIILKPRTQWPDPHLDKEKLISKLEAELVKLPGNHYEFTQPIEMRFNELISGIKSDFAVKVYGDQFDVMLRTANAIESVLNKVPGAADVKVGQVDGLPSLHIDVDRERASQLGLNVSDVLDVLQIGIGGGHAGQIFEGDRRFDLLVKLPEAVRNDLSALAQLQIPIATDAKHHYVPLSAVANLNISEGLNEINRENSKRFIAVESNVRGRDLGSFVEDAKIAIAKKVKIPKGYWLGWGGQFEQLLSARHRLMLVVPICFVCILALLYLALHSFKETLIVFTGVPLALTGGIIALWLRDLPFSISAAVGFIALSGIAVLNGLVLMASINHLLAQGFKTERALTDGALMRLRPVLMTALVASLGFIPMAIATGTGAEVQRPLATVVIGGLISATLLTLVVLPALYWALDKLQKPSVQPTGTDIITT